MTDWCPHPCQLLVLLFQLPFQLSQVFLNVTMTFLSLGAGTVSQPPWRSLFLLLKSHRPHTLVSRRSWGSGSQVPQKPSSILPSWSRPIVTFAHLLPAQS